MPCKTLEITTVYPFPSRKEPYFVRNIKISSAVGTHLFLSEQSSVKPTYPDHLVKETTRATKRERLSAAFLAALLPASAPASATGHGPGQATCWALPLTQSCPLPAAPQPSLLTGLGAWAQPKGGCRATGGVRVPHGSAQGH